MIRMTLWSYTTLTDSARRGGCSVHPDPLARPSLRLPELERAEVLPFPSLPR